MQDSLHSLLFTVLAASPAQPMIFHKSAMPMSPSLTGSPPQTHLPSRQAQLSPQEGLQAGMVMLVSAAWQVGPFVPLTHISPFIRQGQFVAKSHYMDVDST